MNSKQNSKFIRPQRGFALVVTVSLMVLLALMAVGMLSLSAVSLRSATQDTAQMEARANARMALMFAIGELQKHTGADTRITAPADIVEPGAPRITGVWRSWEGLNHQSTGVAAGLPLPPDYGIKMNPYDSDNEEAGRFLTWLISSATEGEDLSNPSQLAWSNPGGDSDAPEDYVALLGSGSLGTDKSGQSIYVKPQRIKGYTGSIAWWVSPENQKARLAQPHSPRSDDVAGWVEMGQSHTVSNPGVFGLGSLNDDPEEYTPNSNNTKPASRAITLASTSLIEEDVLPQQNFHDLSTSAVGLLTNSATGGWRKDLSILTEKWVDESNPNASPIYDNFPGGRLPLFRYTPQAGATSQVPLPTESNYKPNQSNLYPWSNYSVILGNEAPNTLHAASASWQSLVNFATTYKNLTYNSGKLESPFVWDGITSRKNLSNRNEKIYNYKHTQRLYPQVARFQFLVYAKALATNNDPNPDNVKYEVRLMYVPIFTLWNPHNVSISYNIPDVSTFAMVLGWRKALPGAMAIAKQADFPSASSVPPNKYKMFNGGNAQFLDHSKGFHGEWAYDHALPENLAKNYAQHDKRGMKVKILGGEDIRTFGANLPSGLLEFGPGEAKMFSPDGRRETRFGGNAVGLEEGYDPTDVEGFVDFRVESGLTRNDGLWFLYTPATFTKPYLNRDAGMGFDLMFGEVTGNSYTGGELHSSINEAYHNLTTLVSEDLASVYWPPKSVDEIGYSVAALASGPWVPLFSISFGPRMTLGTAPGSDQSRPTKGLVQNNPLASMILAEPGSGETKDHPASGAFDFAYHSLALGSSITPNLSDSEGFIATGYQSGDGLTRLILNEIPLRPMASLIELQGWNPRGNNPYPPHQMNLIGNSDATPLIPKDNIVPASMTPSSVQHNLVHDDAYSTNHLLFDDWFVSSIAPQAIGDNVAKNIESVYSDFLTGQEKLSNRAYQPIPADSNLTPAQATERIDEILNSPGGDGWLKVASRLEVEGMFNINSTSVDAWKAILGHARSREKIGLYGENGIQSTTSSNGHSITRGAVATDVEAGSGAGFGGQFPDAPEYTGFRNLTDEQIQDLSEKIVEQVRLRGPFLSLSEFVNRQLSSNEDLALAGAVQTAINKLDDDPMANLRDSFMSEDTMFKENSEDPKIEDAGFEFAEAAEGKSTYGVPGWIRQADVLRPIAPVLSARDDTFTIRAYGDSLDENGDIQARVWCEAVVKRTRNFVDSSDPADSIEPPTSGVNQEFGRRYEIISFRWLNAAEV